MSSSSVDEKAATDEVFTTNFFESDAEFQKMVMRTTVRFNDRLDPEVLRASLAELVQRPTWRKFAGRFSLNVSSFSFFFPYHFSFSRRKLY